MDSPISFRSGVFVSEEAEGEELKIVMILCHRRCQLSTIIYLNLLNPQASKSENMKANKSFFMVFKCVLSLITQFLPNGSVREMKLENNFARMYRSLFIQMVDYINYLISVLFI